ncbi:MAG: indolepyruvate oxidoreductase subunit beta [Clostridia bacterium]|nr:indolepyruvate oxidoreductase subunit beta [Clostridia bacterium]
MVMTKSILLVGVGGQGAILVSKVLTAGLVSVGFDVKMSEVHGMAQRGGSVSTQVRYGEKVHSPIIGTGAADLLVAFEQMEAVRYANYLKPDGIALISDRAIMPMSVASGQAEYPKGCIEAMQQKFNTVVVKADEISRELGNSRCQNIVLFGALTKVLGLNQIDWEAVMREVLPPKILDINLLAFRKGREAI